MKWNELICLLRTCTDADVINEQREEIASWIPEVKIMFDYDQNNQFHIYDLWMHCVHTVVCINRNVKDDMVYLAALLHDIGKPSCRVEGKREGDTDSHYYRHPEASEKIVRESVVPYLIKMGAPLSESDISRLLYYVKYHDDRVSLNEKHQERHLKMVDKETFKNLMALQIADAKTHVLIPLIQHRVDVCSEWYNNIANKKINHLS